MDDPEASGEVDIPSTPTTMSRLLGIINYLKAYQSREFFLGKRRVFYRHLITMGLLSCTLCIKCLILFSWLFLHRLFRLTLCKKESRLRIILTIKSTTTDNLR